MSIIVNTPQSSGGTTALHQVLLEPWPMVEEKRWDDATLELAALEAAANKARELIESLRDRLIFDDSIKSDDSYLNLWWIEQADAWLANPAANPAQDHGS